MDSKREKKIKIKTNNQELLIRKQNESDATSKCIEFQKTSLITVPILLRFCKWDFISNTKYNFISNLLSRNRNYIVLICRKFQDDRKVVRFLISPKKKKVKIEVNKIMVPAFLLGTAFKECIFNRK